jgi:hypothetical protein
MTVQLYHRLQGVRLTESGVRFHQNLQQLLISPRIVALRISWADVAELADAIDLGSIARKGVEVRVLSSALDGRGPVA